MGMIHGTLVETGAVRVGDRMTVHAGERLSMTGKGLWKIGPNSDKLYGYYLGRPLVCDSTPLRRLVEVLNSVVDTPIVLGRKELGDLPVDDGIPGEIAGSDPGSGCVDIQSFDRSAGVGDYFTITNAPARGGRDQNKKI